MNNTSHKPNNDNWTALGENRPDEDCLIIVTNGNYVEICYYENEELMKPWRFDNNDTPTFSINQDGLMWRKLTLPKKC